MNKQTVALIALFAGWILTADIANATTYEDIAGQWCGDVTDYVFTPNTLTVKFHDDRPANVFKITDNVANQPVTAAFDHHAGEPTSDATDDQPNDECLSIHCFPLNVHLMD